MNRKIDLWLLTAFFILIGIGLAMLHSVSVHMNSDFASRQAMWFVLSLICGFVIYITPIRLWEELAYPIYFLSVFLLIAVLFTDQSNNTNRWFQIGSIKFQPSELAKLGLIMGISKLLANSERFHLNYNSDRSSINSFKGVVKVLLMTLIPFFLIIKEPDLGTAIVLIPLIIGMLFAGGINIVYLAIITFPVVSAILAFSGFWWLLFFAVLLVSAFLLRAYFNAKLITIFLIFILSISAGFISPKLFNKLKPYQKERILTFLNPERDPVGSGYQIIQSRIAIGSGGMLGKGYKNSTQRKLGYLPASHNDFIFSVYGEEFGLAGGIFLLGLISFIMLRSFYIAGKIRNLYAKNFVIGGSILFGIQSFINIAINVGLLPVTGLPLPLISYGGSSFLIYTLVFAFIFSFYRQREEM